MNIDGGNVNIGGGIYGAQLIQTYPINESLQNFIYNTFDKLQKIIDVDVSYASNPITGELNFYLDTTIDLGVNGTTLGIALQNNQNQRYWWEIILNYPPLSTKIDYLHYATLHEIGHALGLEHPFDGSDGDYYESLNSNNGAYPEDTVMAYRSPQGLSWPEWYSDNDIEALTSIWGAKMQVFSSNDDIIQCENYSELIDAGAGDDFIICKSGSDEIFGGLGFDVVLLDFTIEEISSIAVADDGQKILLNAASDNKILNSIEEIIFSDTIISSSEIISSLEMATPLFINTSAESGYTQPSKYSGPVNYLRWQFLGDDIGNVVIGARTNDFINLLAGDDAADGGSGRDVLDGGIGSSFLTGGADSDVFFVDGRNAVATWSTITDFSKAQGDTANMWGWRPGTSQLITSLNDGGAAGYTGATYHYDLDGNGAIDTSITFTGLTTAQVGNPTANSVTGNGYLLFS